MAILGQRLDTDNFPQCLCLAFVSGSYALFTGLTTFSAKFLLKMSLTALFTHVK